MAADDTSRERHVGPTYRTGRSESVARGAFGRLRAAIAALALADRDRWILWLPAALGLGVAVYFQAPEEPPVWIAPAVLGSALVATLALGRTAALFPLLLMASTSLGFAVAQWHTDWAAAPRLEKRLGPIAITARIVEISSLPTGQRLLLEDISLGREVDQDLPRRIRITVRTTGEAVLPGERVRLRAVVMPPPPPALPGSFDFARKAYFEGLGGVGYAVSRLRRVPANGEGATRSLGERVAVLRHAIGTRVREAIPGSAGAIAATLMTGDKGAIAKADLAAMRDSGLAHLLAISGLHLGLFAAVVFFTTRGLLAMVPSIALNYPIKKWAALAAFIGTFAYLVMTGATIPTQRAFLMTGIALAAVMLDRTVISMALAAWAAATILLLSPEALLGPSFQLSFAAVIALIATYEVARIPLGAWTRGGGPGRWVVLYVLGVALTTLVAGLATTPFAIYHFNRLVAYGLIANLVAVPVIALWVMPWAVLAYALMIFGLEGLALAPMGWGIDVVLWIAHEVAALPGVVTLLPTMPMVGLGLITVGGLWLCLWRRAWRFAGIAAIAAGLLTIGLERGPDVLVDGAGKLFAVRTADGALMVSSQRIARFTVERWLRQAGQDESRPWPRQGASEDGRLVCDGLGCIYRARGQVVALVRDPRAIAEDCRVASLVVSVVPLRRACPSAHTVIDRFDLWRKGAHAIWLDDHGVRVETVAGRSGKRPWTVSRGD